MRLTDTAGQFGAATSTQRDERELLRRIDTKFVTTEPQATAILSQIVGDYAALTVPLGNVALYRSLYFDTPARTCFYDHQRGRRIRHKIRIRHYPDRELTFLEVKTKRNEQVTTKYRVPLPFGSEQLGDVERAFLRERVDLDVDALRPLLRVDFQRISLVGLAANERVTLDLGLVAEESGGRTWTCGELVVVEVKQSPFCMRTPVMRALQGLGLRERSMSKYTIATAVLFPQLRRNRLLPELRALQRETA